MCWPADIIVRATSDRPCRLDVPTCEDLLGSVTRRYLPRSNALRVSHRVLMGPWRRRATRVPSRRHGRAVLEVAVEGTRAQAVSGHREVPKKVPTRPPKPNILCTLAVALCRSLYHASLYYYKLAHIPSLTCHPFVINNQSLPIHASCTLYHVTCTLYPVPCTKQDGHRNGGMAHSPTWQAVRCIKRPTHHFSRRAPE